MSRYAIEIGKVLIRSDKPITEEQRKHATARLAELAKAIPLFDFDGCEVWAVVR